MEELEFENKEWGSGSRMIVKSKTP